MAPGVVIPQLADDPFVVTSSPAAPTWPGSAEFMAMAETNAVVASCAVLVPGEAVGAVGMPVNAGLAIGASSKKVTLAASKPAWISANSARKPELVPLVCAAGTPLT